jgi:2-keto-3-deoxy-L-rhamnonate aldolase RhmA
MFPQIDTAEDAAEAVRFTRYPPEGRRGMSRQSRAARYGHGFQEYYAESNASVLTVIQIESAEAVRNAGRIAGTDGVDVLFIGHTDLSLQLGCFGDFAHERVQAAEETVLSACRNAHKTAGAILRSSMDADECVTRGFTLLATGTDVGCLRSGFEGMRRVLRSRKEHRPPLGT